MDAIPPEDARQQTKFRTIFGNFGGFRARKKSWDRFANNPMYTASDCLKTGMVSRNELLVRHNRGNRERRNRKIWAGISREIWSREESPVFANKRCERRAGAVENGCGFFAGKYTGVSVAFLTVAFVAFSWLGVYLLEDELIPCPGCEEELSPYVNKCPKCGTHMHRRGRTKITTGNTLGVAVRLFVGGVLVLLVCGLVVFWAKL